MIPTAFAGPAQTTGALSRSAWVAVGLVLLLNFGHFWWTTIPVRFANPDDIAFQTATGHGNRERFLTDNARAQGRFYFATPVFRYAFFRLYDVRQPWLFSLLRTLAYGVQVGLAAWLAGRVMQSAVIGVTVALFIVGTLHIPDTFFNLLSYPAFWLGFAALLGALHCHYTGLRHPGPFAGMMTAILFLLAALMNEVFLVYLPLFFALSLLQQKSAWPRQLRANIGPLTVAAGFVAVYLLFAKEFPSAYAGTKFSPDFIAATKVVLRQMIGIIPGFELLVNRLPVMTSGPLLRGFPGITATLAAVTWPDVLLGLSTALTLIFAFNRCLRSPIPRARLWPWALGFACLANLPIAFTTKYQIFIFHREFPYAYAYYSFYFLGLAVIGALVCLDQHIQSATGRRLLIGAFALMATAACYSAVASNRRILEILQHRYN